MAERFASFEQIEAFSRDTGRATIRDLRACLQALQENPPGTADQETRERWQCTRDLLAHSLNCKRVHRRFLASIGFGGVTALLILADMFR